MEPCANINEVSVHPTEKWIMGINLPVDLSSHDKNEWKIIFDALPFPISLIDRGGTILRANKALADLFDVDINDIVGKSYDEVFHKGNPPEDYPYQALDWNVPNSSEVKIGERYFKVTSSPVSDNNDESFAYVHVMNDITALKEAEEKIKEEAAVSAALLDVAVAVSSLTSVEEMMRKVSVVCRMVFNSGSCMTYLLDKNTDSFAPVAASGLSPISIPLFNTFNFNKEEMLLVKGLIRDKKVFTIEDVSESPWVKPEFTKSLGISSLMAAPIVSVGEVIGILFVSYSEPRKFCSRDVSILHGISQQVSVAAANAVMYQTIMNKSMELSHKVETIRAMNDIDRSILSSIERDVILETSVNMVGRVISCDMGIVGIINYERKEINYIAGFGIPVPKNTVTPFSDTTAMEVVDTGRPQYYDNLGSVPSLPLSEEGIIKAGISSLLRVPLVVKGEIVGALSIGSKRQSAFTPDDLSTLERLALQIAVALENSRLVAGLRKSNLDIEQTMDATVLSLSKLAEFRDPETGYHLERMRYYSKLLAEECLHKNIPPVDEQFIRDIFKASVLHDIGKVGVKDAILLKPGRMLPEEFEEMKKHSTMGGQIIESAEKMLNFGSFLTMAKDVAYYHHERYDGSGYPKGLKGEEIPLPARIVALADFYDALTSHRIYRDWVNTHEEVKNIIMEEAGKHFDPVIVTAFLKREKDFIDINERFIDK